ncbi:MAG: Ig-like domain-containing protein [Allomuricauda sp.]|uniref:Ig-like domain-containing protein n=1 Tax=Flagellimonas profundi TaxID=2915620 RepID=A0ABS3FK62_9FLAO|nr:Ig-like domain-containing protein [Allomuricauda profundi]MBO0343573.1 Ig-like domain-containing protein [Allomuricauda profundi]
MKKQWTVLLILAALAFQARAQYVISSVNELQNLKSLPQEKVYVHHTGPIVFTGEYLHYSFYCFNAQNNRASTISFVGYVALVNQQGEYIMEQKIRLERGKSQGDFFVNTDVPSGNYKLLGYTQWMKNNGLEQVFKDDLVIINPYQVDQSQLLPDDASDEITADDPQSFRQPIDSSIIQIKMSDTNFGTREKVNFTLKNYKAQLGQGSYTLKIQKKDEMAAQPAKNAISYANDYLDVKGELNKTVGDSLFLPEQRGELLFGKVTDDAGNPAPDTKMVISIPGEEFLLKFATTDSNGNFYTYLSQDYKRARAIMQIAENTRDVQVSLGSLPNLDASGLTFGQYYLKPQYSDEIELRSVYNQLENQFFSVKPDSILLGTPIDPFNGGIPETINLDDFTRFPTFQETLVEVFNYAGYRNNPNGSDYIRIAQDFETYNEQANDFSAIVLFDGVYIPNHEKIKDFDAKQIESISLVRDQFRLAGKDYQGMMVVKTIEGDYFENYAPENGINVPIEKAVSKKNYFKQRYVEGNSKQSRIPDYRRILFWEPHVEVGNTDLQFEFYTSDLTGEFEVVLDGFTTYGKPITVYKTIVVGEDSQ